MLLHDARDVRASSRASGDSVCLSFRPQIANSESSAADAPCWQSTRAATTEGVVSAAARGLQCRTSCMRALFFIGCLVEEGTAGWRDSFVRSIQMPALVHCRATATTHSHFALSSSCALARKHSATFKRALNAHCAHQTSNSEMTLACGRGKRNLASCDGDGLKQRGGCAITLFLSLDRPKYLTVIKHRYI